MRIPDAGADPAAAELISAIFLRPAAAPAPGAAAGRASAVRPPRVVAGATAPCTTRAPAASAGTSAGVIVGDRPPAHARAKHGHGEERIRHLRQVPRGRLGGEDAGTLVRGAGMKGVGTRQGMLRAVCGVADCRTGMLPGFGVHRTGGCNSGSPHRRSSEKKFPDALI
jgi:hypothetical protein